MIPMNSENKKGFFDRPEGVTGMILIAGAIVALVVFSGTIIPFLIALAANLITLVAMCIVLGALAYCILDPKIRNGFFYLFKAISRFFTSWVITIDPIGRAKEYISELKSKLAVVFEKISIVAGEKTKLENIINSNINEMKNLKIKYEHLSKNNGTKPQMQTVASKMGNLHKQNGVFIPMLDKVTKTLDVLRHTHENTGAYIEQLEDDVKNKEIEYKIIKSANSALKSAFSIFNGGGAEREMFNETMDYVMNDISLKMGEMDQIIHASADFLNAGDLEKQVTASKGEAIMATFDPSKIEILTIEEIRAARENSTSGVQARTSSKYDI